MPPFAPPWGSPASAHFQLIQIAKAATSPISTDGANASRLGRSERKVTLHPLALEDLHPTSSLWIGHDTPIARFG